MRRLYRRAKAALRLEAELAAAGEAFRTVEMSVTEEDIRHDGELAKSMGTQSIWQGLPTGRYRITVSRLGDLPD